VLGAAFCLAVNHWISVDSLGELLDASGLTSTSLAASLAKTPIFRHLGVKAAGSRYIDTYILYINIEVKIKREREMGMNGVYRNIGVRR